jgi:hypothetical protein
MFTGGLNISYYYHDSAEAEAARAVTAEVIHAKVLEWTGLDMPVKVRDGGAPMTLATRQVDSAPWTMGSELVFTHEALGASYCSSGIPVKYNGTTKLLTAGHCRPISSDTHFYNNGTDVGHMHTTAYH